MRKLIAVVLVGMSSSVVFAENINNPPDHEKEDRVEFKCRFEGLRRGEFKNPDEGRVECRAEGQVRKDKGDKDNRIEIRCTNGFELRSDDVATAKVDRTLWINADDRRDDDRKIATIRVEDFLLEDRGHDHDDDHRATLLISRERHEIRNLLGDALRLEGACRFENHDHDHDHG